MEGTSVRDKKVVQENSIVYMLYKQSARRVCSGNKEAKEDEKVWIQWTILCLSDAEWNEWDMKANLGRREG